MALDIGAVHAQIAEACQALTLATGVTQAASAPSIAPVPQQLQREALHKK